MIKNRRTSVRLLLFLPAGIFVGLPVISQFPVALFQQGPGFGEEIFCPEQAVRGLLPADQGKIYPAPEQIPPWLSGILRRVQHGGCPGTILPGKSGVTVQGLLTGTELASPGSLAPREMENLACRQVSYSDLDRNGHMNNTKYLEWLGDLLPSSFHREHTPQEFTVCYHAEARETEQLHMSWQISPEGLMQVESWREAPAENTFHRVFAAQIQYGDHIL